ncbi:MAG: type II secretion system F family protein [Lachnospiraceae bacterium]|nr:type II secretion system F family protein [Lachnospiraceae bacterium]
MASFGYEAINAKGATIKGSIEADNIDKATAMLKAQELIPVSVKEQDALTKDLSFSFLSKKPDARAFSIFCRQFVSMAQAGVSLIDSLNMLSDQTENKVLKDAIREVQTEVEKGESLTVAMRKQKIMPDLLCSMVEAGEASGSLDIAFDRMAVHFEKDAKLRAMVKKAAIYPIIVIIVAIAVVIVMLRMVIPTFADMFKDMDMELPAITKGVIKLSDFIGDHWLLLILLIGGLVFAVKAFKNSSYGEMVFAKAGLKMPLFGSLTIKNSSARLARTLSTLLAAGLPLVEATGITADTMDNKIIKDTLNAAKDEIVQGTPLSVPLKQCGLFPPMVYQMTRIGEEAGDIEGLLEKLADYYEEEVEAATASLMAALEPLIIIVLAGIVGTLIGAVMAPMASMYQGLDNL